MLSPDSFKFSHPDPDKIWRLLAKWKNGHSWSSKDLEEYRNLVKEWFAYYMVMGNLEEARQVKKKWAQIMKEIRNYRCTKTTTPQGVRYVSNKRRHQPETFL